MLFDNSLDWILNRESTRSSYRPYVQQRSATLPPNSVPGIRNSKWKNKQTNKQNKEKPAFWRRKNDPFWWRVSGKLPRRQERIPQKTDAPQTNKTTTTTNYNAATTTKMKMIFLKNQIIPQRTPLVIEDISGWSWFETSFPILRENVGLLFSKCRVVPTRLHCLIISPFPPLISTISSTTILHIFNFFL